MSHLHFPAFRPHALLRGGHAQTIISAFLPEPKYPYRAKRHEVPLDDGDRIVLHDDSPPPGAKRTWWPRDRVALLLHGLGGSHLSGYMPRVAGKLNIQGVRTFRMDLRGCGAGADVARRPCHAGRSEDARAALDYVAHMCPGSSITLVGFSMSGNIILKLLGETPPHELGHVDSALAVAPPIDLLHCARSMRAGFKVLYDKSFVRALYKHVQRSCRSFAETDLGRLHPKPRRLLEFDSRFTAPLSGFSSAEEYYARCSSAPLLSQIGVKTLIIASSDDPLIPVRVFEQARFSETTDLLVTQHGGHMGYVGATGVDPDRRWLDWRIVDWILRHDEASTRCPGSKITGAPQPIHFRQPCR